MILNYLKTASKTFLICLVSVFMINCSGDDGADGVNGTDGANGAVGTDGAVGADGVNGEGFEEFAQYGSMTTTLTGTRSDDDAFTDVAEFQFLSIDEALMYTNSFERDGDDIYFNITRFKNTNGFSAGPGTSYVEVSLLVEDAGLGTQSIDEFYFGVSTTVIGDDLKYFFFDDDFDDYDDESINNLSITDFSFDDVTNELVFSYSFDVDGDENDTDNDLTVSGEVSVIVFESIDGGSPFLN